MIIDIHAHLWLGKVEENKMEIMKACRLYDISKVYISTLGDGYYPKKEYVDLCNDATYTFMMEQPQHIGGFCYVNPQHDNCMDVLKKGIEEQGMSGMKLWVATFCDDPRVFPLVEKCIEYKIPILIHAYYKSIGQLEHESRASNVSALANRYHEAKILMAHLGANCYLGIKEIRNCKNVWVDISGSMYRRDEVDYTVKQIGADRILFGTDMPGSYLVNLGQIEEADLSKEERELIYYKNALKILDRA